MIAKYLTTLSSNAIKVLEKYNLILTTQREFLAKNLTNVQLIDIHEIDDNFPCVIHASDLCLIANTEKVGLVFFLTIRNLNIQGISLHWYFMRITDKLWSMERKTLKSLFIENDRFIFTELCEFFKKVQINKIFCKGDISKQLGTLLLERLSCNRKKNSKYAINNLLIFDRTVDLLTPTNAKIDDCVSEKQMLDILLSNCDSNDKLNILLNLYIVMSLLGTEMVMIKREMIYAFGEKLILVFDMIDKITIRNRKRHIYIPDLCKAVVKHDKQYYCFDMEEGTSGDGTNIVFFFGGACQREIDDLGEFTVLTTNLIHDDLVKELI